MACEALHVLPQVALLSCLHPSDRPPPPRRSVPASGPLHGIVLPPGMLSPLRPTRPSLTSLSACVKCPLTALFNITSSRHRPRWLPSSATPPPIALSPNRPRHLPIRIIAPRPPPPPAPTLAREFRKGRNLCCVLFTAVSSAHRTASGT